MSESFFQNQEVLQKKAISFWSNQLQDFIFTEIPKGLDVNKDVSTLEHKILEIPEKLVSEILDLKERLNTQTIEIILFTAHCKVLSVLSGNRDITTGYNIRTDNDLILNQLIPFRTTLDGGSWHYLTSVIKNEKEKIENFKNYSFSEIQKHIKFTDKTFESAFSFLPNQKQEDVNQLITNNSLSLFSNWSFSENEKKLFLKISYKSSEFSPEQIERFTEYYCNTLKLIAANENVTHESQSILPEIEKEKLLKTFNNNKVDFPIEKTFVELFEEQVVKKPNSIAVQFEKISWNYTELNRKANQIANYLIENKIKIEQTVFVIMERNHNWTATVLGVLKAGGTYVPVRPDWPDVRKQTILRKTSCRFILTDAKNKTACSQTFKKSTTEIKILSCDCLFKENRKESNPIKRITPNNLAYIIFTSGSTGEPKGAMIEHKGMLNHLFSKVNDLSLSANDIIAQNSSQSFDISVWQLISGLLVGAKTVIYSDALILNIHQFLHQIKEDKITILELVPSYMEIILKLSNSTTFSNLKYLLVTGEPLKIGLVTSWFNFFKKIPLVNAYGPTEASDDITHHFMYETPKNKIVPVGKPIQNLNIYVVDSFEQLVPIGTKGNVYVSGIGVGRGYISDQEKTNAVFTIDHLMIEENFKLYKTGDIGSWTPEGILLLYGREDSQIKLNGYRIDLGEIEQCLSKQNRVTNNAVLLKEKQLHAFLVFENNSKDEPHQINQCKSELQKDLPHYMIPRKFHVLKKMPLTPNGKIDRKALRKIIISKNR